MMTHFDPIRIGDLAECRVLITGGSTGIGAAAEAVHAQSPENIALIRGDLSTPGGATRVVQQAAETLGGLEGLINNAGGMLGRIPTVEASPDHVTRILNLNAQAVGKQPSQRIHI